MDWSHGLVAVTSNPSASHNTLMDEPRHTHELIHVCHIARMDESVHTHVQARDNHV